MVSGLAIGALMMIAAFSVCPHLSAQPTPAASVSTEKPYHLPAEKLAQAKTLGSIRTALHFGSEFWNLAVLIPLLATGTAARTGRWATARISKGPVQGLIFSALLSVLLYLAAQLPPEAIGHAFSLRYGISVQSWPSWLLDQLKTMALIIPIETVTLTLIFGLMHWRWSRGPYWFWLWVVAVPVMLIGAFIEPQFIEPIFDTFEPLAQTHPALVHELERVVARTGTGIPPQRMFLMKASAKSNGLNAYVSGIGSSKRVVVWDTTADRMPADEILFTFGHESGHYVLNHIPQGLALTAIGMLLAFWATAGLAKLMIRRYSKQWNTTTVASLPGLAVLLLALALIQIAAEPIQNTISRHFEHEADIYGQEAMHGIVPDPQKTAVAAFNELGIAYLDDPNPNPFVEFWTFDHPSIQTRAEFAAQYNPWTKDKTPQFFPR
jgi:Zn-dependent protease with chaperone function